VKIPTNRTGSFADRLVGVNIYGRGKETVVEPVYLPVIQIDKGAMTYITVSWDEPLLVIVLSNTYPFVTFLKAVKNEDIDGGVE